jgi:hypothetical protein
LVAVSLASPWSVLRVGWERPFGDRDRGRFAWRFGPELS